MPGRAILITRPAEHAGPLCAALEARGFVPVVAPLFAVVASAPVMPPAVQAVLVTSGNALAAIPLMALPLLAVGDATAARARACGYTMVHSAGGDAVALAGLASRLLDPAGGAVLLACGAGQGGTLAADLRARGFSVVRRVCYRVRTVRRFPAAAEAAIREGRLHAALFLSAETAAAFVRLLPPECGPMLASVRALAIGKSTADALESLPWLRVCRAPAPTLDDVLALL